MSYIRLRLFLDGDNTVPTFDTPLTCFAKPVLMVLATS